MKLSHARIITKDVTLLARFYQRITGIAPVGNEDCAEIRTAGVGELQPAENSERMK